MSSAADALRAGCDALSCKGLGAVVIEVVGNPKVLDLVASRRLTLAADRSGVSAILLREGACPAPSSAETRWVVAHGAVAAHRRLGNALFRRESRAASPMGKAGNG